MYVLEGILPILRRTTAATTTDEIIHVSSVHAIWRDYAENCTSVHKSMNNFRGRKFPVRVMG